MKTKWRWIQNMDVGFRQQEPRILIDTIALKKKKKRQKERKKKKSYLDYEWISTSQFNVFFSGFALLAKQAHYSCLYQFVGKLFKIYSMGLFLVWFFSALLRGVLIYFVWFASVYLEDGLSDK